jgi:hypothetical protein
MRRALIALLLAAPVYADTVRLPLPAGLPSDLSVVMQESGCFDSGRCRFEDGADGVTPVAILADPPLTDAERTAIEAVLARNRACRVTAADLAAIDGDIAALRTYLSLATPNNAQTAAATKALIRVLRVLVRQ